LIGFLLNLLLLLVEILRFLGNGNHSLSAVLLCCVSQCALHCMINIEHVCAMALAVNIVVIATVGIA